jgi:hypothetical protein
MDSSLTLVNSIVYEVDNETILRDYYDMMLPEITVDHSLVQGGEAGVGGYWGTLNWLEGNIDCDPMFDMNLPNRYSLLEGSPCIDAGTLELPDGIELPEYDLAGNPRISGNMIDMGPYEWQYPNANDHNEIPQPVDKTIVYPNPLYARELRDGMVKIMWSGDNVLEEINFEIFNIKGQIIRSFKIDERRRNAEWDLCDDAGNAVSSGVYFVRVKAGNGYVAQTKVTVLN